MQQKKAFRRDYAKAKAEVSEKNLTQAEKELFYHAKMKELKSFFECGVWEFATTSDSIPERIRTSRMLLKWSKNADGTPRAEARLVVRGFNDVDALNGELTTASPTTSRLSRPLLLSISSCLHWKAWAADVATAFLQGLPQERSLWLKLPAQALEILGASPDTRMFLKKPVYGQIDTPRRWYLEALRRLESLNWKQHQLDPCCFMLYDETMFEGDFPKLVGILILHVDDMLAAGDESSATYVEAERKLKEVFNFRTWQEDKQVLEYCGVQLERKDHAWSIHPENYWHKVKPVTIHKGRSAEDEMNEHDKTQLRALLGSLQWPAVQTAPHAQCSASVISGMQKTNKLRAIIEANQLHKFAKQNLDLRLRYEPLKINSLDDLRLCIMFDAAHGVREDHTSQRGYLAFLTTDEIFQNETDYHVLEWRSFKLPRVARSSLSAEAQACGQSADIAEYIARFWSCLRRPTEKLRDCMDEVSTLKPCLITDAKALYDSYHKESLAGSSSVDKRTGLEIRVAREQVSSLGGSLRWVSSERQYADSLTKMSSRSLLAERLRFHKMKLVWDSQYVRAKKKTAKEREASRNEFAMLKEKKDDSHPTTFSSSSTHPTTTTETPLNPNMFEECEAEQYEAEPDELYEPVEGYAGFPANVKMLVYTLTCYTLFPAASALHEPLDHEHGRWGIWTFLTILVLLLLCLTYAFGYRRGLRVQRALQAATLDGAYASLGRLRERNDLHDEETQQLRMFLLYRLQLLEARQERDLLLGERRAANVMAIMMDSQLRQLTFMVGRVDRLRSLIINHQAPCPLGDSILVQENLDGAEWHLDPECPVLTLNRTPIAELPHCEMCAARDLRMVQDRVSTGR